MLLPLILSVLLFLGLIPLGSHPPPTIPLVAVVADPVDLSLDRIRDVAKLGSVIGDVVTFQAQSRELDVLKSLGVFKAVGSPRIFRGMLDVSIEDIGLPGLFDKSGLNLQLVDGSGVLIAIIDTGVDYLHPAFLDEMNRSRILYIWDQTIEGKPPDGFDYGYECGPDEINSGSCPQVDTNGHGTHVASIAAGSQGVARKASLIVVKSGGPACMGRFWTFDEKGLLDGLAYAKAKARSLGMRLVVNLSLGTDIGAHDGSSSLERALNNLVDEGVVVVVAAGNSASDGRHVTGTLMEGDSVGLRWIIPDETSEYSVSIVTRPNQRLSLTLSGPGAESLKLSPNSSLSVNGVKVEVEENVGLVSHNLVTVRGNVRGGWMLEIVGEEISDGVFHAWLESDTCSDTRETFTAGAGYQISDVMTVSIPGTAEKVITVGAYMTRSSWVTQAGRTVSVGGSVGELEFYSGRGPTADGRVKPDIVAPGGIIIAARSRQSPASQINPSPLERVGRGTSMAAPHVAGVAALILQLAPSLEPHHVSMMIKGLARHDNFTGDIDLYGSNEWGWGKLNADIAYQLPVTVSGLSSDYDLSLSYNGSKILLPGQTAILLLPKMVKTELALTVKAKTPGVRAESYPTKLLVSENSIALFKINTSYYVEVYSSRVGMLFSGWLPRGAIIDLKELAMEELRSPTPFVRRSVAAYMVEGDGLIAEKVVVTRPLIITLVVADDYSYLFLLVIGVAVAGAAIYLGLVYRGLRRRLKSAS